MTKKYQLLIANLARLEEKLKDPWILHKTKSEGSGNCVIAHHRSYYMPGIWGKL